MEQKFPSLSPYVQVYCMEARQKLGKEPKTEPIGSESFGRSSGPRGVTAHTGSFCWKGFAEK